MTLDPIREAMVREDHQPDGPCGRCRRPRMGPCDVTILLAEVDRLRAQVAAVEELAEVWSSSAALNDCTVMVRNALRGNRD